MLLDAVNLRKTAKTDRIKVTWFYPFLLSIVHEIFILFEKTMHKFVI